MGTVGTVLVLVLAAGLLAAAVRLVRYPSTAPWPAIGVCALTAAVDFAVGGDWLSAGLSAAIVAGAVVGLITLLAAVLALVTVSSRLTAPGTPRMIAVGGTVLGALALVLNVLMG